MAHVGQNARFLKTKIPTKETVPSSEKENVATGKKKPSISRDTRHALGSNEERRKGTPLRNEDSRVSRELERSARAKKTPFHIHFDEKNIASKSSVASKLSVASKSNVASKSSVASKSNVASKSSVASKSNVASKSSVASKSNVASKSSVASKSNIASRSNDASRSSCPPRVNPNSKRVLCHLKIESKVTSSYGRNAPKQVNETTSSPVRRIKSKEIEMSNELFGKRHSVEELRIDKQLPPSKIPRRRSRSVQLLRTVTHNTSQRSSSIDWRGKSSGFGSVNKYAILNKPVSRPIEKITVTLGSRNKVNDKRKQILTNSPKIAREKETLLTIKTATPADVSFLPPPPKTPIKVVIQRAKYNRSASKGELLECRKDFKEEIDLSPPELLYHGEYHDELPMIERERERKAPQLSSSFLTRHINAEQRRLVVIFIIRLGIHCRYPSRIVYQSVKLFDAVMDKLSVDTTMIQLYALASLWIVLKRQEKFHKIPSATKMVSLANDLYIGREDLLVDCERKILKILNFNITFADTFSLFTHHFISCEHYINVSEETGAFLYNCGCYMIDITLLDERFCRISARLISITVLELLLGIGLDVARDNTTPRWLFWRGLLSAVLSSPQRLEDKAIDSLRVIILRRVLDSQIQQDSFNVVYKKYCRSRYGRISKPFLHQVTRIPATETIFDP
uniref:uncharacterized protein LOC117166189 n=1 Tax=Bombus vancouverensis nearcticus TaxID=2705178 RepID=UPI00143A1D39|nr:uncharacterized protein LOC117166189 [Bombus vancouverensis nearcticus]